ncbi:Hypp7720 [Branchiostoma lanceolatum]|nr:Hypp7720 [Branchiostoma lanceolatum]
MSQPRPSQSSADVLAELRKDGVLPLNSRGESIAFQVLVSPVKPNPEFEEPPRARRPIRLEKLEETLQERRERVKKEPARSRTKLRQELNDAASRRQYMLEERSRRLAEDLEKRQRLAAERRTETMAEDVLKARRSRLTSSPEFAVSDFEPLETYHASDEDDEWGAVLNF